MTTVYILIGLVGGVHLVENICYVTRKRNLFYLIMAIKGMMTSDQDCPLDRLRLGRRSKDYYLLYAELLFK